MEPDSETPVIGECPDCGFVTGMLRYHTSQGCIGRLKSDLTQARQERDEKHQLCAKLADEIFGLVKERDTLKAALRHFGTHRSHCQYGNQDKDGNPDLSCRCGLTAALGGTDSRIR